MKSLVVACLMGLQVLLGPTPHVAAASLDDFGYGAMKVNGQPALGPRPLLVVLVDFEGFPIADASFWDTFIFGGSAQPSVNGFFLENSSGRFSWSKAGILGPFTFTEAQRATFAFDDPASLSWVLAHAVLNTYIDLHRFDTAPRDGMLQEHELAVCFIINDGRGGNGGVNRLVDPSGCVRVVSAQSGLPIVRGIKVCGRVATIGHRSGLATFCHELMHRLGPIDLYHPLGTNTNSLVTVMASTVFPELDDRRTFHLDPWHKMQLGWCEPQIAAMPSGTDPRDVTSSRLAAADRGEANAPLVLYEPNSDLSDFFILEYRRSGLVPGGGRYDADCSGTGLAIWHIRQDANHNQVQVAIPGGNANGVLHLGSPNLGLGRNVLWGAGQTPQLTRFNGTQLAARICVDPFVNFDSHVSITVTGGATCPVNAGTDVVFLLDVSASTGALLPQWVARIPAIAGAWRDRYPNVRFALASHVDFPFAPFGGPGDWAYRVESRLDASVANLTAALASLTPQNGLDDPESQYEAVFQVLTGEGRDLVDPVDYSGPGEIPPVSLGQQFPMVLYHFTFPEQFHDREFEPDYPFLGSKSACTRTETMAHLQRAAASTMFIGLTRVAAGPALRSYGQTSTPTTVNAVPGGASPGLLLEMAAVTGGAVYDVGADLSDLEASIEASITLFGTSPQANRGPDCSTAIASVPYLWPPDRGYRTVSILGVTDPEGDPLTISVTDVSQDEGEKSDAGDNTCPDARIVGGQAMLRAERAGEGNGRVYTISFVATDSRGGSTLGSVKVCAPHDQTAPCVDDARKYSSIKNCGPLVQKEIASDEPPSGGAEGLLRCSTEAGSLVVIEFGLTSSTDVELVVFDVAGRRVATIEKGILPSGGHQRTWRASGRAEGLYFVRLRTGSATRTSRALLLH